MAASSEKSIVGTFLAKRLSRPILLAILIASFNQLSGINAILYFRASEIFELTGLAARRRAVAVDWHWRHQSHFTFVGLWLIDRLGRRTLLLYRLVGYIDRSSWLPGPSYRSFLHRTHLHLRFHRSPRDRPGSSNLGFFISEIFPTAIARRVRLSAASHTGSSPPCFHNVLPKDGQRFRRVTCSHFSRDDGPATDLGEDNGSGDEGRAAGADSEAS